MPSKSIQHCEQSSDLVCPFSPASPTSTTPTMVEMTTCMPARLPATRPPPSKEREQQQTLKPRLRMRKTTKARWSLVCKIGLRVWSQQLMLQFHTQRQPRKNCPTLNSSMTVQLVLFRSSWSLQKCTLSRRILSGRTPMSKTPTTVLACFSSVTSHPTTLSQTRTTALTDFAIDSKPPQSKPMPKTTSLIPMCLQRVDQM